MIDVIPHAIAPLDQLDDAGTGPQLGVEAVGPGPPEQAATQRIALASSESGRTARSGAGVEASVAPTFIGGPPAPHAAGIDADTLGNLGGVASILKHGHGAAATTFKFLR